MEVELRWSNSQIVENLSGKSQTTFWLFCSTADDLFMSGLTAVSVHQSAPPGAAKTSGKASKGRGNSYWGRKEERKKKGERRRYCAKRERRRRCWPIRKWGSSIFYRPAHNFCLKKNWKKNSQNTLKCLKKFQKKKTFNCTDFYVETLWHFGGKKITQFVAFWLKKCYKFVAFKKIFCNFATVSKNVSFCKK